MNKSNVSIYLLHGHHSHDEYVRNYQHLDHKDEYTVAYKSYSEKVPNDIDLFVTDIELKNRLKTKGTSLCIIKTVNVEDESVTFGITFGFGHHLLVQDLIVPNFGIITLMNMADKDQIRQIHRRSMSKKSKISQEQMPSKSNLSDFGFNVYTDILNGASANINSVYLSGNVQGKEALKGSIEQNIDNVDDYLIFAYKEFKKEDYKIKFPFFDNIKPVKKQSIIDLLDQQIVQKLNDHNHEDLILAFPIIVDWSDIDYVSYPYQQRNSTNQFRDIEINDFFEKANYTDAKKLLNQNFMIHYIDENKNQSINFKKCLLAELSLGDDRYCLVDGHYYQITSSLIREAKDYYNSIPVDDLHFSDCHQKEGDYIQTIHQSHGIFLDRKIVRDDYNTEICDILTSDKKFVHIKKYSGVDPMSHLFFQALNSSQFFKQDRVFFNKMNQIIEQACQQQGKEGSDFVLPQDFNSKDYEIVLCVLNKEGLLRPNLSLFTLLSLRETAQSILSMGFKVAIYGVKDYY